jgi:hypothetical protein
MCVEVTRTICFKSDLSISSSSGFSWHIGLGWVQHVWWPEIRWLEGTTFVCLCALLRMRRVDRALLLSFVCFWFVCQGVREPAFVCSFVRLLSPAFANVRLFVRLLISAVANTACPLVRLFWRNELANPPPSIPPYPACCRNSEVQVLLQCMSEMRSHERLFGTECSIFRDSKY